MEAAGAQRAIEGEKAQRIVDAMRSSVARRGVAGSTFDHVAREAGVSRGLLHYYFATKERLLAEVVRRDAELRLGVLDARLAEAADADGVMRAMVVSLNDLVREDPESVVLFYELFSLAQRNAEVATELAVLMAAAATGWPPRWPPSATRASSSCTRRPRPWPRCCSRSATASRCAWSTRPTRTTRARSRPARARCAR